uniref:Lecithin-cholesterol acyltransferase-like 1 n=1 Tax=Macrostomum lignano TaxID=282301 RepID=A0A1I8IMT1_9PLAT
MIHCFALGLVWLTAAASGAAAFNTPVILVPGDGGNQLWANLNGANNHWYCERNTDKPVMAWLDLINLAYPAVHCLAYKLEMKFDPNTGRSRDNDGVSIVVPGFGETETVEWLSDVKIEQTGYYNKLVDHLVNKLGYRRGVDIVGAPFDFRRAPNEMSEYFVQLGALIERSYAANGNKPVVIVGHSLGCKVILHFLHSRSQAWKDKYVKDFVAAAGPFGGSASSVLASVSGYNLGLGFIRPLWFRDAQRSWPSTYYLYPSGLVFEESLAIVETKQRKYTLAEEDIRDLYQDIGYPHGYRHFKALGNLTDQTLPPGVRTHCVFGHGLKTAHQFRWTNGRQFPDQQPDIVYSDGDGTVNIRSLDVCVNWSGKQAQPVASVPVAGAEHVKLLTYSEFIDVVERAASGTD